jgi:hypothetical protein
MRNFENIKEDLQLKKFLESDLGTLYFIPYSPGSQRIIVRHFNRKNGSNHLLAYVEIMAAIQEWIKLFPAIGEFVKVEQPIEIGEDFIARPHHTYTTSLDSYNDDEDPPEPPVALFQMRAAVRKIIGKANTAKEAIIEAVITRSLLEPTAKTFFSGKEGKFIVVEPKLLPSDLDQWLSLTVKP